MDRKKELLKIIDDDITLIPLVDEIINIEKKLTEVSKLPFYKVNPKNPEQQKMLPAFRIYKELLQQYTNCIKVLSSASGQNESDEEFEHRLEAWYDTDTESKIGVITVIRAQEDIDEFLRAQDEVIEEIEHCKSYYKVPSMCYRYGRQCEFAQICDHYNPELEYVNYKIKEDYRNADLP